MPCKKKEYLKAYYQRNKQKILSDRRRMYNRVCSRRRYRRMTWFEGRRCADCKIEIAVRLRSDSPINPALWDLSNKKREIALQQCSAVCLPCWRKHHAVWMSELLEGTPNPRRMFTSEDVQLIRALRTDGHTASALARRFGCATSAIDKIIKHESYREVPPLVLSGLGEAPALE